MLAADSGRDPQCTWAGHEAVACGNPKIFHEYQFYGLSIRCEIPLAFPEQNSDRRPDVTLSYASYDWFAAFVRELPVLPDAEAWFQHYPCSDGSHYLRWRNLFEFGVSADGRSVACRKLECATIESFQTYLLGQVLSFALVKQGYEPLHSTAVVVDDKAVAFLGESGYGKSTMAAAFVHAGHRVLTDDLLMIRDIGGTCHGFPGPPRLKLFPEVARRFLPERVEGTAMNPECEKLIIPLGARQVCQGPIPIHGLFVLDEAEPGNSDVSLTSLAGTAAFIELVRSAFNLRLVDAGRLKQQFQEVQQLSSRVPIKRLTYPRMLDALPKVREAILADVRAAGREPQ